MVGGSQNATRDRILGGKVSVFQPEAGYRAAIDPVLLAAAVNIDNESRILDVGCGTGASLYCLLARVQDVSAVGLELHDPFAVLAEKGLEENGLESRGQIVRGNIAEPPKEIGAPFDAVMTNPPFYQKGTVPPHPHDNTPFAVTDLSLHDWIASCLRLLRKGGLFAIVHRAERVAEVLAALSGCGAVNVFPLWPKTGRPASRVVVTALKERRSPSVIHAGLVLHTPEDTYTPEADAVLRDGAPLFAPT